MILRRLVDLVVFAAWDRSWTLRPLPINLVRRLEADPLLVMIACEICQNNFRSLYYRQALVGLSPRAWRYLDSRHPSVVFLWRVGPRFHVVSTEHA